MFKVYDIYDTIAKQSNKLLMDETAVRIISSQFSK